MKQLIQAAEQAWHACPLQTCLIRAVQTNKSSPIKHENKRNVLSFDRMFDGLQILSNTTNRTKQDQTAPKRCPNGKMFGHQTMFNGVWSSNISHLSRALPPFSLIRDFGKQNSRGNVSKISVRLLCYRHIGSKSTNHSPLA